jgi:hypothetical protein
MIYICILYLKYLETYLETLCSHFQPNCHFKMFKNSGSGQLGKEASTGLLGQDGQDRAARIGTSAQDC